MSLKIVEPAPLIAMAARRRGLAAEEAGEPGTMVGLEPTRAVFFRTGQNQQPVGQRAGCGNVTERGDQPNIPEGDEQPIRVTGFFAEIPRPYIDVGCLG